MPSCLNKFSATVVGSFERFFYWYGKLVSTHPWKTLLLCLVGAGLCGIGLLEFREELNAFKLWIPRNSDFAKNNQWLEENFPPDNRYDNIILAGKSEGANILTPTVLKEMLRIHKAIEETTLSNSKNWTDLCQKVPVFNPGSSKGPICDEITDAIETVCLEQSILELWGYDEADYASLTQQDILAEVNKKDPISVIFNTKLDVTKYISVQRDSNGKIVGASAMQMTWIGKVDLDSAQGSNSNAGTGLPVDEDSLEFEELIYNVFDEIRIDLEKRDVATIYINVARGYDDIAAESIIGDAVYMPIGFTIVFIYVMVMLGKFNCVETRAFLALAGCTSIGLTILVSYGLCSAFQLAYGPMHNVIPFLMLGIGIDDMFVIMQCFDNLSEEDRFLDRPRQIATAMQHAGVAITVTSITDFIVFFIGATSSLPALSSFCLYCAVGIIAVYFFQATFFVACLSLDLKRMDAGRNGCCFCYKHKTSYTEKFKSVIVEKSLSQKIFKKMAQTIMNPFVKAGVILSTLTLLGVAIWGTTELEVRFESVWFLPPTSYLAKWFSAKEGYFPSDGEIVTLYMTGLNYPEELDKIESLLTELDNATDIIRSSSSWYPDYKEFMNSLPGQDFDVPVVPLSQEDFDNFTSIFLWSLGTQYQPNFYPEDQLTCGQPLSKLLMTTSRFTHTRFDGTNQQIQAMNRVKDMIESKEFSDNVFPIAAEYSNWETDEVIASELYRNLGVSLACITVTTLILLADIMGSLLVMFCVLMTLVDVLGYMYFWGLTIDVVSSINVIISIGLCVDYSAHIAHTFLTVQGSKRGHRVIETLTDIGPAVLNGGISTFIALILLATSDSHVFSSFFRIFLLVILFGLWHGLVFLPCLLSLIGPPAYKHYDSEKDSNDMELKASHSHENKEYVQDPN